MPPKRKAPLSVAGANVPGAPLAKKVAKGEKASGKPGLAGNKKYKYSDPATV
jgi:hypothetical protein